MKLITRDTDYAIRALSCIAGENGKVVTVAQLSGKLCMPRAYLRKILQRLSREGLLKSSKGKGGGFSLIAKPAKITVFSLMEIFQGPFQLSEHLFKGKKCSNIKICYLKKKLDKVEKSVVRELKAISIVSMLKQFS
ncbi:RrF2 family transcriptional regulator [Candidatus Omnitrophota bacterium]